MVLKIWSRFTVRRHAFAKSFSSSVLLNTKDWPHSPVLVNEVIHYLQPQPGQVFVDFTFGAGGHTRALLSACPDITVYCLDCDPLAINYAKDLSISTNRRVIPVQGRFSESLALLTDVGCTSGTVNGVVMDLGASSMQMDSPDRGFGLSTNSPLDMRMSFCRKARDEAAGCPSAADVLMGLSASQLNRVFKAYGEERFSGRIAKAVVECRNTLGPIRSTKQLADLVASVVSPLNQRQKRSIRSGNEEENDERTSSHVATRIFQALRIFVNDELNELCCGLEAAHRLLRGPSPDAPAGRAAVISFHSLEDRLIKRAFAMSGCNGYGLAQRLADSSLESGSFLSTDQTSTLWRQIAGPLRPSGEEVQQNRRSRSAKLRIGEKASTY